jgi:hypothetical protein
MASFVKYECIAKDLCDQVHDFSSDSTNVLKVALTNTAPTVATDTVLANITQLATGNGYTGGADGGESVGSLSINKSGGTITVRGANDVVFTASGGSVGPFRYSVLYNSSVSNDAAAADPLLGYWDYGSNVTLNDGETFTVDLNATFDLFTVA